MRAAAFPKDAYTGIAGAYDRVTAAFLRGPRQATLDACARLRARRVLDVGCGTGVMARLLCAENRLVVGMDISPAMLRAGRIFAAPATDRDAGTPPGGAAGGRAGGAADGSAGGGAGAPLFVRADATRPPFAAGSFDLLVYALVLHETAANAEALLRTGFSLAPLALVLEWRLPERNLDCLFRFWVPGIERLAGREHFRRYRQFMRRGGVGGLAGRIGVRVLYEQPLRGGSLVLALLGDGQQASANHARA